MRNGVGGTYCTTVGQFVEWGLVIFFARECLVLLMPQYAMTDSPVHLPSRLPIMAPGVFGRWRVKEYIALYLSARVSRDMTHSLCRQEIVVIISEARRR